MFNVCPGCGVLEEKREVVAGSPASKALCPGCGHVQEFLRLPLYVVSGTSGSGKTTVALELARETRDYVILDQDIIWSVEFDEPGSNYKRFRGMWLRLAKNINQAGRPVVLFGSSVPDQFESLSERRYFERINYLALVCDDQSLRKRLEARPQWRGSHDALDEMLSFNSWLRANSASTDPPIECLDTSNESPSETKKKVLQWLQSSR